MGRNLYKLVAIDENNNEFIIELKNRNRENKGHLSLIDYGTNFFENENQMRAYFIEKRLNFPKKCTFKIKYQYAGEIRYLSVIYGDEKLKEMLKQCYSQENGIFEKMDSEELNKEQRIFTIELFEELKKLLKDNNFLTIFNVNIRNNRLGMYNILNQRLKDDINKYAYLFNLPELTNEEEQEKNELRFSILRELRQYKQFRTLYLFVKEYKLGLLKNKENENEEVKVEQIHELENHEIEDVDSYMLTPEEIRECEEEYIKLRESEKKKEGTWDFEEKLVVPHEIQQAYKNGGMDEVFGQYDLDDLIVKGLRR